MTSAVTSAKTSAFADEDTAEVQVDGIKWPAKEADYASESDFDAAFDAKIANAVSVEQFKKGQMVCAVQKNDGQAYAQFRVKAINISLVALIKAGKGKGVLKSYPPGQFALVEFLTILPGVPSALTSALTSAIQVFSCTRACVGQELDHAI